MLRADVGAESNEERNHMRPTHRGFSLNVAPDTSEELFAQMSTKKSVKNRRRGSLTVE